MMVVSSTYNEITNKLKLNQEANSQVNRISNVNRCLLFYTRADCKSQNEFMCLL